jgi:hypothetical protein
MLLRWESKEASVGAELHTSARKTPPAHSMVPGFSLFQITIFDRDIVLIIIY